MAESSEMIKLSLPLGTFPPVEIRELTEGGGGEIQALAGTGTGTLLSCFLHDDEQRIS